MESSYQFNNSKVVQMTFNYIHSRNILTAIFVKIQDKNKC